MLSFVRQISNVIFHESQRIKVLNSGYFDTEYYSSENKDVFVSNMDPVSHFLRYGANEGRSPSTRFDVQAYFSDNPTVRTSKLNPVLDWLIYGHLGVRIAPKNIASRDHVDTKHFDAVPVVFAEPRILIVDATYPTPDRDSGSVDADFFIKIFQKLGYKVYYIATADFDANLNGTIAMDAKDRLNKSGVCVLDSRHGPSPSEIIRLNGGYFRAHFLSRIYCGGELYEHIRAHCVHSKIIFNTVDLHSLRESREARITNSFSGLFDSYRTAEREYYLARLSDATLVVSNVEKQILTENAPGGNVHVVPLIREIPGRSELFHKRSGIGFIGGYRHQPNVDAVQFFLDNIWPLVIAELPDVKFYLMGADLPEGLASRDDPGLVIVGHVHNLSEAYHKLRLSVAPLRYGAGAKGKVVTSLVHGVPCVASPIAAEGMALADEGALLVGNGPADFAEKIVQCYSNERLWMDLSERGLKLMRENHSFDSGVSLMQHVLTSANMPNSWHN